MKHLAQYNCISFDDQSRERLATFLIRTRQLMADNSTGHPGIRSNTRGPVSRQNVPVLRPKRLNIHTLLLKPVYFTYEGPPRGRGAVAALRKGPEGNFFPFCIPGRYLTRGSASSTVCTKTRNTLEHNGAPEHYTAED